MTAYAVTEMSLSLKCIPVYELIQTFYCTKLLIQERLSKCADQSAKKNSIVGSSPRIKKTTFSGKPHKRLSQKT